MNIFTVWDHTDICYDITLIADIDECESPEGSPCPAGSHCLNTNGSFVCSCDAGYHYVKMNGEPQGMCIGKYLNPKTN